MAKIIITSLLLGIALAMDACAASMTNGMKEPKMNYKKIITIGLLFGIFQGLMPLIGYLLGSVILSKIEWIIPYVALVLLLLMGIKMIVETFKSNEDYSRIVTYKLLFIQAIATSIDALTVGFSIANYKLNEALITVLVIALITFVISICGVYIGKLFGNKLGKKAEIIGGIILILIGLEIFISGVFL